MSGLVSSRIHNYLTIFCLRGPTTRLTRGAAAVSVQVKYVNSRPLQFTIQTQCYSFKSSISKHNCSIIQLFQIVIKWSMFQYKPYSNS